MLCPSCCAEIAESVGSCPHCGASLLLQCPRCGSALPPEANYCSHCGHAVGVPAQRPEKTRLALLEQAVQRLAPQGYADRLLDTRGRVGRERRTVTILFCDVQGSTALSEGLDPEDVMEIMDGAFDVLIPSVYRYEGTLARLMGDAVLAFFGAPIAHEDDPERACRAALEIIEGVREYAARLEQERGIPGFDVRVGIHTGLVVVGEVGSDLRVEYTAMGDAVNLAQRLESAAEAGTILISADTQRLIEELFETDALEPQHIKGRTEPVVAYRVTAPKPVREKPRGVAGLDSPLVGRDAEFVALLEAVDQVRDGQGGIVTIVGEAGIGKSRLVAEVRRTVRGRSDSPPRWIEGRCLSYSGNVAYQLWTDMLRHLLGIRTDASPGEAGQALRERVQALCPERFVEVQPYLANLLALPLDEPTETHLADLPGEQLRANTFQAVQAVVECTAIQQPLVLVCEDIYWSDPTSMEVLERLLPLTERTPLLFFCVFRPRKDHPSWHIREVAAEAYAHRHTDLWLQPLSEMQSETLVHNLLRTEDLAPTLRTRILHLAEGNPLYVEEIIRALITQGAIVQDDASGQWQVTPQLADVTIPDTLNGVLTARIDRLPEEPKRALQVASVLGRIFSHRILAAVAKPDRPLDEHLLTLQHEEMIRERAREPEREYIFKHELTREAAYSGMLRRDRRALHCQVAQSLERLFPERLEEQLGLLAHHWELGGDTEKAIAFLMRAGDRERLAYAHQEAVAYYQRALALAEKRGDVAQTARAWMKLGLTHHGAFDFAEARQAYDEGFRLWQQAAKLPPASAPLPAPHALRMDWFPAPATLDTEWSNMYAFGVLHALFSRLAEHTVDMDVVPDVAQSWEVSEGGSRYTFHLRDDVRWSDGTPVTAPDFEYAWKRLLDPLRGWAWAGLLYDIRGASAFNQGQTLDADSVGVCAPDDFTLTVDLEGPTSYFLHVVDLLYPVPRHLVEVHGDEWAEAGNIATCGPFLIEDWQPGKSLTLARYPEYFGQFSGNLQRIVLDMSPNPSSHLQLYEDDALDVLFPELLPHAEMNRAQQRHRTEDLSLPKAISKYLGFDVSHPPFDDVRVRRAFALATDRAILPGAGACAYFPATGGLIPPATPGHSLGIAPPFHPEQARQLLAAAGYPGGRGFPSVTISYVQGGEDLCRDLQAQWREHLGVEVLWETTDLDSFLARLRSDPPQLFSIGTGAFFGDPDCPMRCCPFRAFTRWQHSQYDHLVEASRRTMDQDERMALYRQAENILMKEVPILVLMYGLSMLLVKPWVKRLPLLPTQRIPLWKDIILEPH